MESAAASSTAAKEVGQLFRIDFAAGGV